ALLVSSLAFAGARPAWGWNSFGHMTVAAVAHDQLTPATRNRVSALLKKNPDYNRWVGMIPSATPPSLKRQDVFEIAATWSDQIKGDQRYTDDGTQGGNRPDAWLSRARVSRNLLNSELK